MLHRATSLQMIREDLKNHFQIYLSKCKEDCDRVLEEYIAETNETEAGLDVDIEAPVVVLHGEIESQKNRMAVAMKMVSRNEGSLFKYRARICKGLLLT